MKREEINSICDKVRNFALTLESIIKRSEKRNEAPKEEILDKLIHRTKAFLTDLIILKEKEKE